MSERPAPTERELQILSVLWERGSGTVAEIQGELIDLHEFELAYTTVLSLLQRMRVRRLVKVDADGKGHRYYPVATLEQARKRELHRITDLLYGGSREDLLAYLLSDEQLPRRSLESLQRLLARRLAA